MKFALIFCLSYMFLSAKCGLIKNLLGTVNEEVHKLAKGNVVVNTVKEIVEIKKGIISDLSHMVIPNSNNNHGTTNTVQQNQTANKENDDILSSVSKPTVDLNEIIQPINTKPILGNGPIPGSIINTNKEEQVTATSSLNKPIVFDQGGDVYITEFGIEPRISRQIQQNAYIQEASMINNETDFNDETFNIVIDKENESIVSNFDIPLNYSGAVETVVVEGCPEGFEIAADGSCVFPFNISTNVTEKRGKNRANFFGGCFMGYAHAEDGTCQEVIYD